MTDFVLEVFSEEIPARMHKNAVENFHKIALEIFTKNNLAFEDSALKTFISPRRLVLMISGLKSEQIQLSQKKIGPKVDANPKAIDGFLKSTGQKNLQDLEIVDGFYVFNSPQNIIKTAEILKNCAPAILKKMQTTWPKIMRYDVENVEDQVKWVRPIRSILALLGHEIIDFEFNFIRANNTSFDRNYCTIEVKNCSDYFHFLDKNNLTVDHQARRQNIIQQLHQITHKLHFNIPENFVESTFLDEIVGMCESPTVLVGAIDDRFLELPHEALNLTLKSNQKYICGTDLDGKFSPKFLFICDCGVNENNRAKIIADNEKIMRARLTDLEFFINEDLKKPLAEYASKLKYVVHHQKIGNMQERVERMKEMAKFLSIFIPHCDINLIDRAVDLCKADLATKAVYELPELQGKFGSFYAQKQFENHKIVEAIHEHYLPLGASSATAKTPLGIALAIADKIDTLVGFFLVNEKPTSSKDPYALRRCVIGIIRTAHQHNIAFPIRILVERSLKSYAPKLLKEHLSSNKKDFFLLKKKLIEEIVSFIVERLKFYLKEQENISQDIVNVVIDSYLENLDSHKSVDILYLIKKIHFLNHFVKNDANNNLLALYKRSANILSIEEKKDGKIYRGKPSMLGFKSKYEKLLYKRLKQISNPFYKLVTNAEFAKAFDLLLIIQLPLSHFFEHVVVNDKDKDIRENRLILLSLIRDLFHEIGDLSKIEL